MHSAFQTTKFVPRSKNILTFLKSIYVTSAVFIIGCLLMRCPLLHPTSFPLSLVMLKLVNLQESLVKNELALTQTILPNHNWCFF